MTGPLPRRKLVAIAFMAVWMVFWLGGMIVAVYVLGGAVLAGEFLPAVFLILWLGAAGYGLYSAGVRLIALATGPVQPRRNRGGGPHRWSDGYSDDPGRRDEP